MIDRITAHNLWVLLAFPVNEHMPPPLLSHLLFAALRGAGVAVTVTVRALVFAFSFHVPNKRAGTTL